MSTLDTYLSGQAVSRIRRNHGLEHATLHVLAEKSPHVHMAGHSDVDGFWLLGDLTDEAVEEAVGTALGRLQAGEEDLAVHPNCGTNFVASGVIAGLAAWLGMLGTSKGLRSKLERIPIVITLTTMALVFAQPVGLMLQARVTTSGRPGSLRVTKISAAQQGHFPAHRILTDG
jgi:Domain of unknown function (DUF6391)